MFLWLVAAKAKYKFGDDSDEDSDDESKSSEEPSKPIKPPSPKKAPSKKPTNVVTDDGKRITLIYNVLSEDIHPNLEKIIPLSVYTNKALCTATVAILV